jgi:hypothetical protein
MSGVRAAIRLGLYTPQERRLSRPPVRGTRQRKIEAAEDINDAGVIVGRARCTVSTGLSS